eukprot:1734119-Prymnesium_polylepis.1
MNGPVGSLRKGTMRMPPGVVVYDDAPLAVDNPHLTQSQQHAQLQSSPPKETEQEADEVRANALAPQLDPALPPLRCPPCVARHTCSGAMHAHAAQRAPALAFAHVLRRRVLAGACGHRRAQARAR